MKEIKIEHLAYLLKHAKENNEPQPIFFLGAGASRTGNIPLASEIISKISADFSESPFFKDLKPELRTYATLMECLLPAQRDKLLKDYINEAKINVTHIYLAQLLHEGYVDYILTVNFDNLMLRALALYNIFPPTYDLAILTDLTTTTFKEKSVVYLHGQNHGLWLLNTPEEMAKVRTIVPRIFDSIKNGRPWIFIGYSAEDPVFEHIQNLGRFDNGLYWVAYNDHLPTEKVLDFISGSNTNASLIKGYDSDSFMLKLNSELGLNQPRIVDKPFTALKEMLNEIVDIDDKEHFQGVKERLEISKKQVDEAIEQYELGNVEIATDLKENNEVDRLKKEIINIIITENYDQIAISEIENQIINISDLNLQNLLGNLYLGWGNQLSNTAKASKDESLYYIAFEKFQKAASIKLYPYDVYNNWGNKLSDLAKSKKGSEVTKLYLEAIEKYKKAIEIRPETFEAHNNWGLCLENLARLNQDDEANILYKQAIEHYKKAIEIEPNSIDPYFNLGNCLDQMAGRSKGKESEALYNQAIEQYSTAAKKDGNAYSTYNNWGNSISRLAKLVDEERFEKLFLEAFDKFRHAIEISPERTEAYNNWGNELGNYAKRKGSEEFYYEAFDKFNKSVNLKPKSETYYNWGSHLVNLAQTKEKGEAEKLYNEAIEKFEKNIQLGGMYYNLACLHALKNNKMEALSSLEKSLEKDEISVTFVKEDSDWESFRNDVDFLNLLSKHEE